jgi:TonB family protein
MRSLVYVLCLLIAIAPGMAQQTKPEEPIYKIEKDVKAAAGHVYAAAGLFRGCQEEQSRWSCCSDWLHRHGRKIHDAAILRSIGDSALDSKVLHAVKRWTFHPCTRDDKPINCTMNIETKIHLN